MAVPELRCDPHCEPRGGGGTSVFRRLGRSDVHPSASRYPLVVPKTTRPNAPSLTAPARRRTRRTIAAAGTAAGRSGRTRARARRVGRSYRPTVGFAPNGHAPIFRNVCTDAISRPPTSRTRGLGGDPRRCRYAECARNGMNGGMSGGVRETRGPGARALARVNFASLMMPPMSSPRTKCRQLANRALRVRHCPRTILLLLVLKRTIIYA
jgi:hypothetical protein